MNFATSNECKFAIIAAATNPQFKLKWLTIKEEYNTETMKKLVKDLVVSTVKNMDHHTHNSEKEDSDGQSSDDFFEYAPSSVSSTPVNSCEMEVLKFLNDQKSSIERLNDYPDIKRIAIYKI